jgi:hypothetical protein
MQRAYVITYPGSEDVIFYGCARGPSESLQKARVVVKELSSQCSEYLDCKLHTPRERERRNSQVVGSQEDAWIVTIQFRSQLVRQIISFLYGFECGTKLQLHVSEDCFLTGDCNDDDRAFRFVLQSVKSIGDCLNIDWKEVQLGSFGGQQMESDSFLSKEVIDEYFRELYARMEVDFGDLR